MILLVRDLPRHARAERGECAWPRTPEGPASAVRRVGVVPPRHGPGREQRLRRAASRTSPGVHSRLAAPDARAERVICARPSDAERPHLVVRRVGAVGCAFDGLWLVGDADAAERAPHV